ncbi:MAG TPA: serine/threonine-protein kinase, partial [Candidatus Thermoplasmatota archaeon]|nr:serine/threonine-protein kinase [Candidatus Thermoplasmatota archaeon]
AGALSAAWLAWLRGARRPALRGGAWAGLALTVLLDVPGLATAAADLGLLPDSVGGLGSVGRAAAALRWLLFGAAASMAVFRDDLLGMSLAARRRAARATLGLAFVLAAAVGLLALDAAWGGGGSVGLPHLVALAGAALVSQGFRRLVDRAAARVYGVPLPGDALAAREAYRRAAALAASRGRVPENDPALARLRDELGLDEPTARLLARLADEDLGPLAAGQAVAGRYQVERFLGRGAAGRAFVATDLVLGRRVVLKEVLTDGAHDASIQEARLAGALQHPAVVTVHDVLQRPGRAIIVQEHVPGGTLADRLAARGPYGLAAGAEVLRALVGGVAAVHDRGILHLDIKPENVLLVDDCTPKLGDFGVARLRGATLGAAGPVGTPGYAAPELLRGEPPTPACDVHALGRLALRCLGAPLPPAVEAVLARAVDADPARRPATAGALLADLERAFAS